MLKQNKQISAIAAAPTSIMPPHDPNTDGMPIDVFQRHLIWTKEEIDALPTELTQEMPIYLGAELDISKDNGEDFFLPEYKQLVDYWIAGMHSFFNESYLIEAFKSPEKEAMLNDYFEEWGNWVVKYITDSRPDILVYPFWQELERGLFEETPMYKCFSRNL